MAPNQKSDAHAGNASKKRKTVTLEKKVDIIKQSVRGEMLTNIGQVLGSSLSTIGTILRDKSVIMDHVLLLVQLQLLRG